MATRKRNVVIDTFAGGTDFKIYSDLSQEELSNVEGVSSARSALLKKYGFLIFEVDPRYDSDEVIDEIKLLCER